MIPLFLVVNVLMQDHPRGCGEQQCQCYYVDSSIGSPPRVRGTVLPLPDPTNPTGITPAGAGNSILRCTFYCGARDHPRGCGEQVIGAESGL